MRRPAIAIPGTGAAAALCSLLLAAPGFAAGDMNEGRARGGQAAQDMEVSRAADEETGDVQQKLQEAQSVVEQMKEDEALTERMRQAKGVFIVPDFARGAAVAGVRGGSGVMLAHRDGQWSDPVFHDLGGISLGAQGGVSAGSIAMLLMSDYAVDSFTQDNNWSLNAEAGLSFIDWSANAQASAGKGDIILWSDTEGLFAGAQISVSDVSVDEEEMAAFYGRRVGPDQVVAGNVAQAGNADALKNALP
jgi:SH3 domain-containing YSC84-like protein 1